jgi:hypothetical protein
MTHKWGQANYAQVHCRSQRSYTSNGIRVGAWSFTHAHVLFPHVAPTWATTRATARAPIRILFPWLLGKQNSSVHSLQLLLTITCHFTPHQTKVLKY